MTAPDMQIHRNTATRAAGSLWEFTRVHFGEPLIRLLVCAEDLADIEIHQRPADLHANERARNDHRVTADRKIATDRHEFIGDFRHLPRLRWPIAAITQ